MQYLLLIASCCNYMYIDLLTFNFSIRCCFVLFKTNFPITIFVMVRKSHFNTIRYISVQRVLYINNHQQAAYRGIKPI